MFSGFTTSVDFRQKLEALAVRHALSTWLYWAAFAALSVKLLLPIWSLTYLPLGDLPDHAGQIKVIMNFQEYEGRYIVNWFTPYLVAYGITLLFATVFPLTVAVKLTLSLAVLAFPVAGLLLVRALKGDRFWVLITFPVGYSFSFYWGFFSFIVGASVALFFIVFAVHYAKRDRLDLPHYLLAALFSLVLFFAHALVWLTAVGVACLIIYIYNDLRTSVRKASAFLLIIPIVVYWSAVTGQSGPSTIGDGYYVEHYAQRITHEIGYILDQFHDRSVKDEHSQRVKEFLSFSIGQPALWDYILLAVFLLIWPLLLGSKLTFDWRRWLPVGGIFFLFMVTPYWIFDTAYVYFRFSVFLLPLSLFLYNPQRDNPDATATAGLPIRRPAALLAGFCVVWSILGTHQKIFASFAENDSSFKKILESMEPRKKVLALILDADSALKYSPAYMHFGSWYQAEKLGEVVFSFAVDPVAHGVPLRYIAGSIPYPNPWNPGEFNWRRHKGADYDYFLVRAKDHQHNLFSHADGGVIQLAHHGKWYLYGRQGK